MGEEGFSPGIGQASGVGQDCDPFPDIPPALLNSADIEDYVRAIGLIDRNDFRVDRLKPASYEIGFGNYFAIAIPNELDSNGNYCWKYRYLLHEDSAIILPPNSMIYVSLDTRIKLPPYIAARFNLKIKHVYRGLLAGSGPLVDPGFQNKLFVPLHNLSSKEYSFRKGDGFIWMEFTKISPHPDWKCGEPIPTHSGRVVPFPKEKAERMELIDYLTLASDTPIRSSVDFALEEMREKVDQANKRANEAEGKVEELRRVGWISGLILMVTIAALVIATITLTFTVYGSLEGRNSVNQNFRTTTTVSP